MQSLKIGSVLISDGATGIIIARKKHTYLFLVDAGPPFNETILSIEISEIYRAIRCGELKLHVH